MNQSRFVSSAEAAALAGVGPSSIKRWADTGILPCIRTAGGHRRIERSALMQFLRERSGADAAPGAAAQAWVSRLVAERRHDVDAALFEMRARLGAWHCVADELGPVITEIGAQWQAGRISIAQEHAAAECLARALGRVGDTLPAPAGGPRCLLACAEADEHTLGLSLAELCAREVGWVPIWFGRRAPRAEIAAVVRAGGADVVALSASSASRDEALLASMVDEVGGACAERRVPLLLGGTGAWPASPRHATRLASFADLHEFARQAEMPPDRADVPKRKRS